MEPNAIKPPEYSPGPWSINTEAGGRIREVFAGDVLICDCGVGTTGSFVVDEANARLIAAAPELLEACKMVLLFHDAGPWTGEKSWQWFRMYQSPAVTTKAMCDRIREVIARAEGAEHSK